MKQALTYLGITALACIGYGAVFLIIGLFFRNPIIPAILIYGWEWINFLLPPLLKKLSVIHYLHSLTPVPIPEGPFACGRADARVADCAGINSGDNRRARHGERPYSPDGD